MRRTLAVMVAVALAGAPVEAASILDPLLGAPGDCYHRSYDEAHLGEHPRQMVEHFALYYNDGYQDPNAELTLSFDIVTRDGKSYEGVGICTGNRCGVEGDGGAFTLAPYRDGLLLSVAGRMHAEGAEGFLYLENTDDTEFLLFPGSPRACNL